MPHDVSNLALAKLKKIWCQQSVCYWFYQNYQSKIKDAISRNNANSSSRRTLLVGNNYNLNHYFFSYEKSLIKVPTKNIIEIITLKVGDVLHESRRPEKTLLTKNVVSLTFNSQFWFIILLKIFLDNIYCFSNTTNQVIFNSRYCRYQQQNYDLVAISFRNLFLNILKHYFQKLCFWALFLI